MTSTRPEDGLSPEYQELYRELHRRMGPGGDLSPGDHDTYGRYRRGVLWEPRRELLHAAILEDFKQRCAGLPRDGHAALLTAGAPGAGKGSALRGLATWQDRDDELGRALTEAHGIDVRDYVVLDPDEFKVALFEHGGGPELPDGAYELLGGRRLSPSETASLTHRESAYLQGAFEQWARAEGYNLLYDATLRDQRWNEQLLGDLRDLGYDRRVLLSVEVPLEQCLAQNADRWQKGRAAFDEGRDWYGGRMAPEGLIEDLYARGTTGRGHSVGRENAEQLLSKGLATGLITSDRAFPSASSSLSPSPVSSDTLRAADRSFQQESALIRVAAAGRLRSAPAAAAGTGTAPGVGPGTGPGAAGTPMARTPVVPPPTPRKPPAR